jgi:DNA sulfur modification protein DndB
MCRRIKYDKPLYDYCKGQESFEMKTISDALTLDGTSRILQEDVKGLGGTKAASVIQERLISYFNPIGSSQTFKI